MELKKPEVAETRAALQAATNTRDQGKMLDAVQRVVAYATAGVDMSALYPDMVKACNTRDFAQKKLVYVYLCEYGRRNAELALLAINTLRKDSLDASPLVRGLAVRSMGSLRLPNLLEYTLPLVLAGLADPHPYVRRAAVFAVAKLHPLLDDDFRGRSVDMLRKLAVEDPDPQTALNAMFALRELLNGGFVAPIAAVARLLGSLRELGEWAQCQVLTLLAQSPPPEREEDAVALLNALDERLQDSNSAVVLAVADVFLRQTRHMPQLHREVFVRVRAPLLLLADTASAPEIAHAVLTHLRLCLARFPDLLEGDYSHFFVRPRDDPAYLRLAKIDLLTLVASERNAAYILDELGACVSDADPACARAAIVALGRIARKLPAVAADVAERLRDLLALGNDAVGSGAALVAIELLRRYPTLAPTLLPAAVAALGSVDDPDARAAVVWAIGEFGDSLLPDAPYVLEHLAESWSALPLAVKHALLVAVVKLLIARPAEARPGAGRVIAAAAVDDSSADLRDRAALYYRLLQLRGPDATAAVVTASTQDKAPVVAFAEDQRVELDEQLFEEFNSFSVAVGEPISLRTHWVPPATAVTPKSQYEQDETVVEPEEEEGHAETQQQQQPANVLLEIEPMKVAARSDLLVETPAMDPAAFQKLWGSLTTAEQQNKFNGKLAGAPPDVPAFVARMKASKRRIVCIAAGIVGDTAKVYAYGQLAEGSHEFCLVEMLVSKQSGEAAVTVKSKDTTALSAFAAIVRAEYL